MESLLLTLMRALGPQILAIIQEQFNRTGTIPSAAVLDSKLVAQADAIIKRGEDWLTNHPPSSDPK